MRRRGCQDHHELDAVVVEYLIDACDHAAPGTTGGQRRACLGAAGTDGSLRRGARGHQPVEALQVRGQHVARTEEPDADLTAGGHGRAGSANHPEPAAVSRVQMCLSS